MGEITFSRQYIKPERSESLRIYRSLLQNPPEWLQLKRLKVSSIVRDKEPLEFSDTTGRSVNWYKHFGKGLAVVH